MKNLGRTFVIFVITAGILTFTYCVGYLNGMSHCPRPINAPALEPVVTAPK